MDFASAPDLNRGETEDYRIGCKGKYRAVQIISYHHFIDKDGVNADAYHNEETLKTEGKQPFR